jgi:hypothetical protein
MKQFEHIITNVLAQSLASPLEYLLKVVEQIIVKEVQLEILRNEHLQHIIHFLWVVAVEKLDVEEENLKNSGVEFVLRIYLF